MHSTFETANNANFFIQNSFANRKDLARMNAKCCSLRIFVSSPLIARHLTLELTERDDYRQHSKIKVRFKVGRLRSGPTYVFYRCLPTETPTAALPIRVDLPESVSIWINNHKATRAGSAFVCF